MRLLKKRQQAKESRVVNKARPKQAFSYYSSRNDSETSTKRQNPEKPSRIIYILRHLPVLLAGAALFIGICYILTLSTNPKVVAVNAGSRSQLLRSQTEYQQAAEKLLSHSLSSRTKITIDANGFEQAMKKLFPELSNVTLTLPIMGRRPIVELQAAQPALILQVDHGDSFVIDTSGKAIMPANMLGDAKALNLPTVLDQSGLPVEVGKGVLTADEVEFITVVLAQLKAKNIEVESLTLPTVASELHLKPAGQPYYVKFDLQSDPKAAAGSYLAVKQKLDQDHVTPKEYIDVRVDEKAYYK